MPTSCIQSIVAIVYGAVVIVQMNMRGRPWNASAQLHRSSTTIYTLPFRAE